MKRLVRSSLIWLRLLVLAFANGAIRELGIRRIFSEPTAHHLSALTGVLLMTGFTLVVWRKIKINSAKDAVRVGLLWFTLTLTAEVFVVNRWMSKLSWNEILQTYNLARGELWPLVLIWIGVMPIVIFKGKQVLVNPAHAGS